MSWDIAEQHLLQTASSQKVYKYSQAEIKEFEKKYIEMMAKAAQAAAQTKTAISNFQKNGVRPTRKDALGEEIGVGSLVLYHSAINASDSMLLFGVVIGVPFNEQSIYVDVLGLEPRRKIVPRRYSGLLKSNVGQLVSAKIRQARKIKEESVLYSEWSKYWTTETNRASAWANPQATHYIGELSDVGKYA